MIVQCDFDGTIIQNNLSVLLREHFARGDWRKIESDYLNGDITVEQSNILQYTLIREPEEKLQEFVGQQIEIRPGFGEFVQYCQDVGVQLIIVSSGLDFYIETVLNEIGRQNLELHCGQTSFSKDGIVVSYHDPDGDIIDRGFKRKYLARLKKRDGNLIYIGDGLSDLEPARAASYVFATSYLFKLLSTDSVSCSAFSDFHDLLNQIHRL